MNDRQYPTQSTRPARQAMILELIEANEIASQAELAKLLADNGISVSQGTLSRDLLELGAVRVRNASGALRYAPPRVEVASEHGLIEARLARLASEVLISASASGNMVVVKTPPGAAQYFASAVDKVANPLVLGSIAGDDTVLLVAAEQSGGQAVVEWLIGLGERTQNVEQPTTEEMQ